MQKYKNIALAIKQAFPDATDIRVIVFTGTGDKSQFEGDIDEIINTQFTLDMHKDVDEAFKTKESASICFRTKIVVTDEPKK